MKLDEVVASDVSWWPKYISGTPISGGDTLTIDGGGTVMNEAYFGLDSLRRQLSVGREFLRRALGETLTYASASTPIENDLWGLFFKHSPKQPMDAAYEYTITFTLAYIANSKSPQIADVRFPTAVPALQMLASPRTFTAIGGNANSDENAQITQHPAVQAYRRLCQVLPVESSNLAKFLGVRRTTPYKWLRENSVPRSKTERDILSLHASVAPLVDSWGLERTRNWLASQPMVLSLLAERRFDHFASVVREALNGKSPTQRLVEAESIASEFGAKLPTRTRTVRGTIARIPFGRTSQFRSEALATLSARAEALTRREPMPDDSMAIIGVVTFV